MMSGNGKGADRRYADAYELIASLLHCRKEDLTPNSSLLNTPGWDSMVQVEIMLVLADDFGIEVTDETIATFSQVAAIQELMASGPERSG
jgi:acyl carrier protein